MPMQTMTRTAFWNFELRMLRTVPAQPMGAAELPSQARPSASGNDAVPVLPPRFRQAPFDDPVTAGHDLVGRVGADGPELLHHLPGGRIVGIVGSDQQLEPPLRET